MPIAATVDKTALHPKIKIMLKQNHPVRLFRAAKTAPRKTGRAITSGWNSNKLIKYQWVQQVHCHCYCLLHRKPSVTGKMPR